MGSNYMIKSWKNMKLLYNIILSIFWARGLCGQIRGGNLQYYTGPFYSVPIEWKWMFTSSNISSWYDINMGLIQYKQVNLQYTTMTLELSSSMPYTVCQNIILQKSIKYELHYEVYTQLYFESMLVSAYVNGTNVSSLIIPGPYIFGKQTSFFVANQTGTTQICFNETLDFTAAASAVYQPSFLTQMGGMIDNISLIPVQLINFNFSPKVSEVDSSINLISDVAYSQLLAQQLVLMYKININGYGFIDFDIFGTQMGTIAIQILSIFNFSLQQLQFVKIANSTKDPRSQFNFQIMNPVIQVIQVIQGKQSKQFIASKSTEKQVLQTLEKVLNFSFQISVTLIAIFRTFFCSYLIIALISFQNLSLLYIFLEIKSIPQFTRQIYQELYHILITGFSNQVQRILKISNTFQPYFQIQNVSETLLSSKYNENWLGYFEYSSLFLKNNFQNLCILFLLLIKIFVLNFVLQIFGKITGIRLFKRVPKVYLVAAFILQFISTNDSFIISAVPRIQISTGNFIESLQKQIQILTLFLSTVLIAIYFILEYQRKSKQHRAKNPPTSKMMSKKFHKNSELKSKQIKQNNAKKISKSKEKKGRAMQCVI